MEKWMILGSETVFEHPLFRLQRYSYRLPGGKVVNDYYVVEENDVACVFAMTPEGQLLLVEQYKHGIDEICLELPAGYFNDAHATGEDEARRELLEETGYGAPQLHFVGTLAQDPTRMNSRTHLFATAEASHAGAQSLDANEDILVRLIPLPEAFDLIRSGRIHAAGTVAGIFMGWDYVQRHGLLRKTDPPDS